MNARRMPLRPLSGVASLFVNFDPPTLDAPSLGHTLSVVSCLPTRCFWDAQIIRHKVSSLHAEKCNRGHLSESTREPLLALPHNFQLGRHGVKATKHSVLIASTPPSNLLWKVVWARAVRERYFNGKESARGPEAIYVGDVTDGQFGKEVAAIRGTRPETCCPHQSSASCARNRHLRGKVL